MNGELSKRIPCCRVCGSDALDPILDLGRQPPANSLRSDRGQPLHAFPLDICRCASCCTVQLTETVDPEHLFRQYVWVTGTSQTAREYSKTFREHLRHRAAAKDTLFVVEVASNDGTFLRRFQEAGDRILGIDPAQNIARQAGADGVPTWAEFFGREVGRRVRREMGPADAVFARNVLPHVPDPLDVLAGMAECLDEQGIAAVEFHQADAILHELHYDSIYHEHLFYHSLHTMEQLLHRAGLQAFDLIVSPISGGSLVVYCAKHAREPSTALQARRRAEEQAGTNSLERWLQFAQRSQSHRERLRTLVESFLHEGKRLIGYGASARSSTLLNYSGIDQRHLLAIADRSAYKHYRWTPGTDIQVLPPREALELCPDAILLLAWNFREEIVAELKEQGYQGTVILPLPGEPTVMAV